MYIHAVLLCTAGPREGTRAPDDNFQCKPPSNTPFNISPSTWHAIIRFFARNNCKYGSECRFQHDAEAVRARAARRANKRHHSHGHHHHHGPRGASVCHFFAEGKCKYGSDCRFVHVVGPEMYTDGPVYYPHPGMPMPHFIYADPAAAAYYRSYMPPHFVVPHPGHHQHLAAHAAAQQALADRSQAQPPMAQAPPTAAPTGSNPQPLY